MKDGETWIATRDLEDVDLYDVSAVTYPAYEDTSVGAARQDDEGETYQPPDFGDYSNEEDESYRAFGTSPLAARPHLNSVAR
jgi:hypothetical protein